MKILYTIIGILFFPFILIGIILAGIVGKGMFVDFDVTIEGKTDDT